MGSGFGGRVSALCLVEKGYRIATITAQAERAMALWPDRGEADPRPPLGTAYERLQPVAPKNPVVPDAAPGALRLSLLEQP
jgi:cholesterol oxidase